MGHNIKPGVAGDQVQEIFNYERKGFALPAVNVTGSSTINGVLETAAKLNSVIIQFSNGGAQFNAEKDFLMQMKISYSWRYCWCKTCTCIGCIWSYSNTAYRPLCKKKTLPWIDGLLDASEEHFCNWKTIIQLIDLSKSQSKRTLRSAKDT
jgi:fructose-bisphosphate aldolase class II